MLRLDDMAEEIDRVQVRDGRGERVGASPKSRWAAVTTVTLGTRMLRGRSRRERQPVRFSPRSLRSYHLRPNSYTYTRPCPAHQETTTVRIFLSFVAASLLQLMPARAWSFSPLPPTLSPHARAFVQTTLAPSSSLVSRPAVCKDIISILSRPGYDDGSIGPVLVRLSWHASGALLFPRSCAYLQPFTSIRTDI